MPVVEGVFQGSRALFDLAGTIFKKRSMLDKIHKQRPTRLGRGADVLGPRLRNGHRPRDAIRE
jgi:hypothetical protein